MALVLGIRVNEAIQIGEVFIQLKEHRAGGALRIYIKAPEEMLISRLGFVENINELTGLDAHLTEGEPQCWSNQTSVKSKTK